MLIPIVVSLIFIVIVVAITKWLCKLKVFPFNEKTKINKKIWR